MSIRALYATHSGASSGSRLKRVGAQPEAVNSRTLWPLSSASLPSTRLSFCTVTVGVDNKVRFYLLSPKTHDMSYV